MVRRAVEVKAARPSAPTMSDVARKACVSTMTVSRALRDGASIASETREKIMKAVEELGYVLDQSAGSLSSKRTGFVAALVPSLNNSTVGLPRVWCDRHAPLWLMLPQAKTYKIGRAHV